MSFEIPFHLFLALVGTLYTYVSLSMDLLPGVIGPGRLYHIKADLVIIIHGCSGSQSPGGPPCNMQNV